MSEDTQGQEVPEPNTPTPKEDITEEAFEALPPEEQEKITQQKIQEEKGGKVKSEPKEPPKEEIKEEPKKEPKEKPEQGKERKPREIPAWQVEIDKKRVDKDKKETDNLILNELKSLKSDLEELKKEGIANTSKTNEDSEEEIDKKIEELGEKYEKGDITINEMNQGIRKLTSSIPKAEMPEGLKETMEKIEKIEKDSERKKEDNDFSSAFDKEVVGLIKEEFPHALDEDLTAIKDKVRDYYFQTKYITLSPLEIYKLNKSELKGEISPSGSKTSEEGVKGAGGSEEVIDFENITVEQYDKMTPEEQDKVDKYKISKQNEARGVKTNY